MSCPDLDTVLDAGFDAPAHVRAHLATCPACAAELEAAAALAAGFAEMRAEAAPPALVDAALTAARSPATGPRPTSRRAPDRLARPSRPRRSLALLLAACALGMLMLAAGLWLRSPSSTPVSDAVAARPAPTEAAPESPFSGPRPAAEAAAQEETSPALAALPAPGTGTARPAPAPPPAPRQAAPPDEPAVPETPPRLETPVVELAAAAPLPDSVAAARDGALLAFSLVADAQRVAGRTITHEAERLGTALSDAVGSSPQP